MTLPAKREWTVGHICADAESSGCGECGDDDCASHGLEMAPNCHPGAAVQVVVQSAQRRLQIKCAECSQTLGYVVDSQRTNGNLGKFAN